MPSLHTCRVACRSHYWWENSARQLKQLGLLLVVVVGRPLGNYIQTLMVITLLVTELAYELAFRPARHHHLQYMQAAAIGLLVYSALAVLLLQDFQNHAAQGGLAAASIGVGVCNIIMLVLYVYYIARASRGKVQDFVRKGEHMVYRKLHRQLVPYAALMRHSSWRSLDSVISLDIALSNLRYVGSGRGSGQCNSTQSSLQTQP